MSNDNVPPSAPADLTPNQRLLFHAISEAMTLIPIHSSEAIPVFEWWAKWERGQQENVDRQ